MRTTAYQLHRQGGGVVMLDLGVVMVEREQVSSNRCNRSRQHI